MLVADLTHYLDIDDTAPAPARNLAAVLCAITRAATAGPVGPEWSSALRCRCRPARKPCPGHLVICRTDQPSRIAWRCDRCGDEGVLSGWQDSPYDLRPTRHSIGLVPHGLVEIPVSEAVGDALRDLQLADTDAERVIWSASRTRGKIVLCCDADQLEDLVGWVAAEANHEPDRRRQRRLDTAFETLNSALTHLPD